MSLNEIADTGSRAFAQVLRLNKKLCKLNLRVIIPLQNKSTSQIASNLHFLASKKITETSKGEFNR